MCILQLPLLVLVVRLWLLCGGVLAGAALQPACSCRIVPRAWSSLAPVVFVCSMAQQTTCCFAGLRSEPRQSLTVDEIEVACPATRWSCVHCRDETVAATGAVTPHVIRTVWSCKVWLAAAGCLLCSSSIVVVEAEETPPPQLRRGSSQFTSASQGCKLLWL